MEIIHNHPEGIKGAEATAAATFLARTGHTKAEIRDYISTNFGYDLTRTCDEIRTAVSLGGDCDTLTAIAGSIAEGFYGVPEYLKME